MSKKPVVTEWSRINIDAITILDRRLRGLRENGIAELVASFNEVEQLNPITVRPQKGGSYVLIAGLRRKAGNPEMASALRETVH